MIKRIAKVNALEIYEDDVLVMMISETIRNNEVYFRVSGDIKSTVVSELEDELMAAVSFCGRLFIDLSGVRRFDDGALQSLLTVQRTADEADAFVAILSPSPVVRAVFDDYGFYQIMDIRK